MEYFAHIVVLALVYTTLATSLRALVGETGVLSFAHAAFYGIGAYTSAILTTRADISFPIAFVASMCIAGVVSLLISVPSLKLYEDHLVLATFGFSIIITGMLNNCVGITGGADGVTGIPPPRIAGVDLGSALGSIALAFFVTMCSYLAIRRIVASPFGRVLRAIREDEVIVAAYGRNPASFKIGVFAIAAALAGAAGSIYAHHIGFIDPSGFTVLESILVLSMVILGGAGTQWGPIAGAVVLVTFPEALRFIGFPSGLAAELRQILYGALLILTMAVRPQGLLGRRRIGR